MHFWSISKVIEYVTLLLDHIPHLNCSDAVHGALLFHTGDARGHSFKPSTLWKFLFWLEAPSHLGNRGGERCHCEFRQTVMFSIKQSEFSSQSVSLFIPRHPNSAAKRRVFMLVGPVSRSVEQTVQEEDRAFIAQEHLLRFPNVGVCPSHRIEEKQKRR